MARRAIFDALRPDDDGVAWELVTNGGELLHVADPNQLAINSSDQALRLAVPAEEPDPTTPEDPSGGSGEPGPTPTPTPAPDGPTEGGSPAGPAAYLIHELTLANRSLTDPDNREQLYQLLGELAAAVNPTSGKDIQVATIRVELNAAEGSASSSGHCTVEAAA